MRERYQQASQLETPSINQSYPFLAGGGEMGERTRNHDWATSPLGKPEGWSQSLRTLVQMMLTSRFPMLIFWGPQLITFYNDAFRPSLGDNGKHPSSLGQRGEESWAESWPVIGPMIQDIMAGGDPVWFEDQKLPIYRDGAMGYAYWTYSFSPLTDDTGAVNGILVTCSETTDAVINRQKLEESERFAQSVFFTTPVANAVFVGEDMVVKMANQNMLDMWGRDASIVGERFMEAMPELASTPLLEHHRHVLASGETHYETEEKFEFTRYGQPYTGYYNYSYKALSDAAGERYGVICTGIEVTDQVLARQKAEESAAQFRSLIEEAPVATALFVGRDMVIEVANQPILDIWGKGNTALGKPLAEALPELRDQPFLQILDDIYTSGEAYSATADKCDLVVDGRLKTFYFNFTYKPLRNAAGEVYAIMDMAVDVTEQVFARLKLVEAEAGLRGAVELAQLGTWSIDVATNGLTYSDRLIEWFGYDPGKQPYNEVIPILEDEDQERVANAVAWALNPESDGIYEETYTVIHPETGQKRVLHAQGKTVFDATGKAVRMNGTAQDVTEQRKIQLALEQQVDQRTRQLQVSVGDLQRSNQNLEQFAYVASHDLQEPLRKIRQFGEMLKTQYADRLGDGLVYLERMQAAANRMSILIIDLLTYSRISTQQNATTPVSLTAVVESALTDLELRIRESGAVVHRNPLPTVSGDATQLGQLFSNLLSNALKFQRSGVQPLITIRCQVVTAADLPPSLRPSRPASAYYRIDVADNGIGFDEKYLDRIFQVFQRLHGKNQYVGTGIGLAICEKVASNHGGAITATSQPDQGATFSVYLPIDAE